MVVGISESRITQAIVEPYPEYIWIKGKQQAPPFFIPIISGERRKLGLAAYKRFALPYPMERLGMYFDTYRQNEQYPTISSQRRGWQIPDISPTKQKPIDRLCIKAKNYTVWEMSFDC